MDWRSLLGLLVLVGGVAFCVLTTYKTFEIGSFIGYLSAFAGVILYCEDWEDEDR